MCTFSMEHILYSIYALQNINEYHYIWGSDLQEFGLKGFGLTRVYCTTQSKRAATLHFLNVLY